MRIDDLVDQFLHDVTTELDTEPVIAHWYVRARLAELRPRLVGEVTEIRALAIRVLQFGQTMHVDGRREMRGRLFRRVR